jgi:hypothetical protein
MEVCHLKVLQVKTTCVVIAELDIVPEVGRTRHGEMYECLMIHRRNDMLLLRQKRDVRIADLRRSREEVPLFCNLRAGAAVQAALGVSWASQRAVHDTPLAINDDSVPPMVGTCNALHIQDLSWAFEISTNDFRMQADSIAHVSHQHSNLFTAATLGLYHPPRVWVAFVLFFPRYALCNPGEDSP